MGYLATPTDLGLTRLTLPHRLLAPNSESPTVRRSTLNLGSPKLSSFDFAAETTTDLVSLESRLLIDGWQSQTVGQWTTAEVK